MSRAQRWGGRCIDLNDLIPRGEIFEATPAETEAAKERSRDLAELLSVIARITRGEWKHLIGSKEACKWKPWEVERDARWQREYEEAMRQPYESTSFGPEGQVNFIQNKIDDAWVEEVRRRIAAVESGQMGTIPAEEVFRRLREMYPG